MFPRSTNRKKDGKDHRYFSVVENRRLSSGKTTQRTVIYLGEINDKQESSWRKTMEVFDEDRQSPSTLSLFPDDREIPLAGLYKLSAKYLEAEAGMTQWFARVNLSRPRREKRRCCNADMRVRQVAVPAWTPSRARFM